MASEILCMWVFYWVYACLWHDVWFFSVHHDEHARVRSFFFSDKVLKYQNFLFVQIFLMRPTNISASMHTASIFVCVFVLGTYYKNIHTYTYTHMYIRV
jgi:hypothetical protein